MRQLVTTFLTMKLDDHIIDIELTPNRGDCASLHGIAREVSLGQCEAKLVQPYWSSVSDLDDTVLSPVTQLLSPEQCSTYCSRVILDIDDSALTPVWMQERLRRSGLRSLNPVVDVLNFVMLETGQPMHAFDLERVQGDVLVRSAVQGEKLTLLDGRDVELDAASLVIADESGALALAGISGGEHAAVGDTTKHVLLESAYFDPVHTSNGGYAQCARLSYRFERGVDFQLQKEALERATALLVDIVGGRVGVISELKNAAFQPQTKTIQLRYEQVERLLGVSISQEKYSAY